MFEFSYLYDNFKKEHALGSYTFSVYSRFLSKITGQKDNFEQLQKLPPRTGVYTTLFGPLYIDFGWFIIPFILLFGIFTKRIYQKAISGNDVAILIYFYLAIVIIFSPVFNFINGAGGIFMFTSFIVMLYGTRSFYRTKIN